MKRELTGKEINYIIDFEDRCGVNTLVQLLFSSKNPTAYASINDEGQIGEYEVVDENPNKS